MPSVYKRWNGKRWGGFKADNGWYFSRNGEHCHIALGRKLAGPRYHFWTADVVITFGKRKLQVLSDHYHRWRPVGWFDAENDGYWRAVRIGPLVVRVHA